jgi:hypothetical protein
MLEGKKMGSYKKNFEVAMFFSSQNINFPFLFEETLEAFLFPSLFFFLYAPSLEDSGVLIIFEEKITSSKTYFQMV